MNDMISRKMAIDALDALCDRECEYSKQQRHVMCGACRLGSAFDVIEELPSVRIESTIGQLRTDNQSTKMDVISRKAAITAIQKAYADTEGGTDKLAVWKNVGLTNALHIIQDLPSAQPESSECISRSAAIDAVRTYYADECGNIDSIEELIEELPSAQPEIKPIEYRDCANAMLKMWMDNVVTDGEYNRIMDKLNAHCMTDDCGIKTGYEI